MPAPTYTRVKIANLALAEVPDKPIASLDEGSLQAREINRHYDQCVGELLEEHPWTWALARVSLASVTNDRSDVWGYAYAIPENCAYIGKVFQTMDQPSPISNPCPGSRFASNSLAGLGDVNDRNPGWRFELGEDAAVLYTDINGASMEFTRNDVLESKFKPQFVRGLSCRIAARASVGLNRDVAKRRELWQLAETEVAKAKANDRNRERETYGDFIPDWVAAR